MRRVKLTANVNAYKDVSKEGRTYFYLRISYYNFSDKKYEYVKQYIKESDYLSFVYAYKYEEEYHPVTKEWKEVLTK